MPKKHLDFNDVAEIQNVLLQALTADPTIERKVGFRNGRIVINDGTSPKSLAYLDDVTGTTPFRGGYDASSGSLPAAATVTERAGDALVAGNYVFVTVAGTIAGIGGADALEPGDLLFVLGADPAVAANWYGVSRSLDVSPFVVSETVALASLPANTATLVAASTIQTINDYTIIDASGNVVNGDYLESLVRTGAGRGLSLTSLVADANLNIVFSGLTV